MIYTAYPAAADLTAFLGATALDVPPSLDLQGKCDAASAEFEQRVGWNPYLAVDTPASPSTRLLDPPGPLAASGRSGPCRGGRALYLSGGLLSLTSLAVGVVPDQNGNYAAGSGAQGTILTPNLNFYLRPENAPARGLAYTEAEFLGPVSGAAQSVAVTGVWGRVAALPADVWQAVLQRAAALCVPEISLSISGGFYERRVGDSLKRFGGAADSGPLAFQSTIWNASFQQAVRSRRRITA